MPRKEVYDKNRNRYSEYQKQWAEKRRDKLNRQDRERHRGYRQQAIRLYGGKCACCCEDRYEFLAIDHINGGGTRERKEKFPNAQSFYRWIRDHHEPEKYRLLCHNCNSAMGYYGVCPHDRERSGES